MIPMTLAEVAGVVGGRIADGEPDIVVTVAASDDRDCVPGTLFAAIAGERVDGHDYIASAREHGAVAALTTRPVGSPAVVVEDVVLALGALASYVIQRLPGTLVLALTGSSGKTTTKDLLAAILAPHGETVAPRGSFNSEVGLPLTVLSCTTRTKYLVLEMGMRGHQHISYLCDIAHPRIAGVINVGSAHIELLGSQEAIAVAKAEIIDAAKASTALLEGAVTAGLIEPKKVYTGSDLVVLTSIVEASSFGLEPRHLRGMRLAVDREVGLISQAVNAANGSTRSMSPSELRDKGRELSGILTTLRSVLTHDALNRLES